MGRRERMSEGRVMKSIYKAGGGVMEEACFFGLLFDRLLTWASRIRQLKHLCQKPLDLLRYLSHTSRGSDRKPLLLLSKSFILSKLDYGSSVYSSAAVSHLRGLDPVQSEGLHLATGALLLLLSICRYP